MNILIVSDYGILIDKIKYMLSNIYFDNYAIYVARNYQEAIFNLVLHTDLIIIDQSLPGGDKSGADLLTDIRKSKIAFKDTKILLMDADDEDNSKVKEICKEHQAMMICKNFDLNDFKNALICLDLLEE